MPKGLNKELRRQRRLKRMREQAAELTPVERFTKCLALKKATACILKVEDEYNVYVKLVQNFKDLEELAKTEPFEGCEQCHELIVECEAKVVELKARLPKEIKKESRTVMTSAKEREKNNKKKKKGKGKWIGLACILLIAGSIWAYHAAPTRYYIAQAEHVIGLSKYAMESYDKLGSYKDCSEKKVEMEKVLLTEAKEGDEVVFGKRKWIVLEKKDGNAVLTTVKALHEKPYHATKGEVTWENCSLREFLNGEFITKNFGKEEQAALVDMNSVAEDNEVYGTDGGNDTVDKVTIFSGKELEKYKNVLGSKCKNMRLRTPGEDKGATSYVSYLKEVIDYGFPVEKNGALVRPVITVKY